MLLCRTDRAMVDTFKDTQIPSGTKMRSGGKWHHLPPEYRKRAILGFPNVRYFPERQKKDPFSRAFFRSLLRRGRNGLFPVILIPEYPEIDYQGEGFVHCGIRCLFDNTFLWVFLRRDLQRLSYDCFHGT